MRKKVEKMYRIKLATSNFYYVQKNYGGHWSKVGGYHASRRDAQQLIKDLGRKDDVPFPCCCPCTDRVVEYA